MSSAKILFVDHAAVLGGAQLSLLDVATAFRDRSTVVLFEDGPFAERLRGNGVEVEVLVGGAVLRSIKKSSRIPSLGALTGTFRLAWKLARIARHHALVYTNSPKSFLVGALGTLLARRPIIWHVRDIIDRTHFSAANIRLMVMVANWRAARLVANSQATADAFVAAGGRREQVRVVHNGIDASPFDSLNASVRSTMRASLGVSDEAFVVGSFSRLHPWKGQRVLFDALEQLPDVHALIVGGALFSGEAEFERELLERSQSSSLQGRVHLLGARNDVAALMAACDVIVHTSIAAEPFGRVIVEALLARRPLIASNAGGVREIVEHDMHALLTEPGNVRGLRDAIAAVRDNRARAAAFAKAGSIHVRTHFSRDSMIRGVTRVIDDVLAESV